MRTARCPEMIFWCMLQNYRFMNGINGSSIAQKCNLRSQNHRLVWVGRDLTDHPVPPPCPGQGPLPPEQGAPSPAQPGLEPCQGGGSHSFSGQPGPGPHHPHREELLPWI